MEEIAKNPHSYKELTGKYKELHSARFGDHRLIYSINEVENEVVLLAVEPRSAAYGR